MDYHSQTDAFQYELSNLIEKFREEFDLNEQSIIGCLEVSKLNLITDFAIEFIPDEEDEDDDVINPFF